LPHLIGLDNNFTSEEQELAFEKIDYLLSSPGNFSKNIFEFDPVFDNLRGLAEYTEILQKQI
jgi:hypothetical protein